MGVLETESCVTMREQCSVICLPACISVTWGVVPELGKHLLKTLGMDSSSSWCIQDSWVKVAADGSCGLGCCILSSASSPGATASRGFPALVLLSWSSALLAALLWSNHLMRTFGLRRWRFLHGRLSWAAGMHCKSLTRWFSAALIWSVW